MALGIWCTLGQLHFSNFIKVYTWLLQKTKPIETVVSCRELRWRKVWKDARVIVAVGDVSFNREASGSPDAPAYLNHHGPNAASSIHDPFPNFASISSHSAENAGTILYRSSTN